mmetsp:Transcript_4977/g.7671  ORF Transcript_4977/g.7671 Transcript_4977/m.7671 type:complete len:91 (-) Transcript_4977:347-619(-)
MYLFPSKEISLAFLFLEAALLEEGSSSGNSWSWNWNLIRSPDSGSILVSGSKRRARMRLKSGTSPSQTANVSGSLLLTRAIHAGSLEKLS